MNTTPLSQYAPQARQAFIAAVSAQAAKLGITAKSIAPAKIEGDILLIEGQALPKAYAGPRNKLADRVQAEGFDATMDAIAYTWFNRFAAIRYMELHNYLDYGYRVLSHPDGQGQPEILEHVAELDLPGLDKQQAIELKLDGTQDQELYRLLLKAQCNALHQAMPFLFEPVNSADELLLPANLLHTDSLIRNLVNEIPEALWQDIEIIGWLYQFYISQKKDEVIGKVVKSEDIPAATQLFTPNWIVKYMVQNSLGAQWLATYPASPLKAQMQYYIEPAEQTIEVNEQLKAITPDKLNPEELTLIDPASGSGHILTEAYELFKAIYLERGYRQRDVPELILEKNLFGLDIDERAAQLTGFALMMKGRSDDRRLFEKPIKLNVMALADSTGFDGSALAKGVELSDYGLEPGDLTELKDLFEHATTFGSLIQVPEALATKLQALKQLSEATSQDLFVSEALKRLGPLVQQAELLAAQYDAVVANPPYMGSKAYCSVLKAFVGSVYKDGKSDLYGAFMLRNVEFSRANGHVGMITIPSWMFLSSFEELRNAIVQAAPISSLVHNGRGVWGSDFGSCSFVLRKTHLSELGGRFLRLFEKQGSVAGNEELERRFHSNPRFSISNADFKKIPGTPIAYWVSNAVRHVFQHGKPFASVGFPKVGMQTSNNDKFLRLWQEVSYDEFVETGPASPKWIKYLKGGSFRRWFGNLEYLLRYNRDPAFIKQQKNATVLPESKLTEPKCTWTDVTSGRFHARYAPPDTFHDISGHCFYPPSDLQFSLLAFSNTKQFNSFLLLINPTIHCQVSDVGKMPLLPVTERSSDIAKDLVGMSELDWDAYERSWDFQSLPLLTASSEAKPTLESSYTAWITQNKDTIAEMKRLEEENNRLFIDAYGLADELTPDVPIEQITLTVNPAYRYGKKVSEEEQWTRFRQDTCEELVSFGLGCMMGRYSLDAPGLIYAHSGNEGFDPSQYTTFPADDDGIVPLTDTEWFEDDACNRVIEFISKAWDASHLEENLTFLAENLGPRANEPSRETIRRYLCDSFFKDHLQRYKKRPIYWLFSSGKHKAFQCLVYLHRYNEGTLSRMRAEYVIPLQGKMAAHIEQLKGDIQGATSTAQAKRFTKTLERLEQQHIELLNFDEKLRHYADKKISLDLDDGVKVNYGQFGDLLAEVKAVHGKGGA